MTTEMVILSHLARAPPPDQSLYPLSLYPAAGGRNLKELSEKMHFPLDRTHWEFSARVIRVSTRASYFGMTQARNNSEKIHGGTADALVGLHIFAISQNHLFPPIQRSKIN